MAKEIAEESGISERKVRDDFVRLIDKKVKEVEERGEIVGKKYGEGEDWLLVTRSIDLVFKIITSILDHNTEYKHYEKVPLEIGIGVGQYDRWAKFDGSRLIVESSTIAFLKTHIIDYYREWHKQTYSRSIKSTFIVLTESAYEELEPLDRKICKKVEYEGEGRKGKERKGWFFVAEIEKFVQRGMVLNFLEKLNRQASSWYRRIDRIFVPPNEYDDVIRCLEKYGAVFLIGDPEIGKTYTAVRILWEYYCKGYNPVWHSGSEFEERRKIRQTMSDCRLQSHSMNYFEDPFGRTKFEDREEIRRTIGSFVTLAQESNAKVIITSREEIFKEFNKERLSQSDLDQLTVEMRLMQPSYTKKKMEEILLDWAAEFDCKWLRGDNIKSFVLIEAGNKLTTPLSLRDFALASKDYDNPSMISSLITEKSKEVKEAFAEEIAKMAKEKILFLSLVYLLGHLEKEKIKAIYGTISVKLGLDPKGYPFEHLEKWFETKITHCWQGGPFEFTHPSYEEGLVRSWSNVKIENFFMDLINELINEDYPVVRGSVGYYSVKNFEELSFKDKAERLILTLLNDKNAVARYGVSLAIKQYFAHLPPSLGLKYLEIMAGDRHREIRAAVATVVGDNFSKIPMEQSLEFISRGLEDRAALVRLDTVDSVNRNLEDLPEEIVVKALNCCEKLRHYSGWTLSYFAGILYHVLKEKSRKTKTRS